MSRVHFVPEDLVTSVVEELISVLAPYPGGLRRWSVMNAIRQRRRAASQDIPLKMESDIERIFRQFCANDGLRVRSAALFCRPEKKAGEVWAMAIPPVPAAIQGAE